MPTSKPDPSLFPNASARVRAAYERAASDALAFAADPTGVARAIAASAAPGAAQAATESARRSIAIGDPQAPLERFLEILDRHDLLGEDGQLARGIHLVSMGDHFDWGHPDERLSAGESATRLLSWLAAHEPSRVTILVGNHDLARVGELVGFDDDTFGQAQEEARALRAIPFGQAGRAERRHAFLSRFVSLPSVGVALRDLSTFARAQRDLVAALLRTGRLRAAHAAAPDLLLIHAGVTPDDLDAIRYPRGRARAGAAGIARALNERFDAAVAAWDGVTPFALESLYRPGSYDGGESRGIFVQRPADPEEGEAALFEGPPRRRFDPHTLTMGLTQVTGHIRDNKCRDLMPRWSDGAPAVDGPLRHLWTDGREVRYRRGMPDDAERLFASDGRAAMLLFADGGMNHAPPAHYELLDLAARAAVPKN
jgi:hypothetical protein